MSNFSRLAIALLVLSPPAATVAKAETPFVKIKSPANGTVVHPGEEVTIVVDATPGAFTAVTAGIFTATSISGPPYKLTMRIPSDEHPGPFQVRVWGVPPVRPLMRPADKPEDMVKDTLELDLELVDQPKSLECRLLRGQGIQDGFHRAGEKRGLYTIGIFDDERKVDLSWTKLTTYASSDPSVVTVNYGLVTAVGPGRAKITVKYRNASLIVPIVVPDKPDKPE